MKLPDRVRALFEHLGIDRAHFAGGAMGLSLLNLCGREHGLAASLTLVLPQSVSHPAVEALDAPLAVVLGDSGASNERVARVLKDHPPLSPIILEGYATTLWSDVARERGEELIDVLFRFLTRVAESDPLVAAVPGPDSGSVSGLLFTASGEGPPLVLFPLGLSASQWAPLVAQLSRKFLVIQVRGGEVEPTSILEARGKNPGYRAVVSSMIDGLDLKPGTTLLEVGCGSGAVSRFLSESMNNQVRITGIDVSAFLLSEAALLRDAEAPGAAITYEEGNAEAIPFPANSFDAVVSVTMLEEVNANRAIAEMVRVTRPGGRVGAVTRAVDIPPVVNLDLPEEALARLRQFTGIVAAKGCADASLYRRFRDAGLEDIKKHPQYNATAHLLENVQARVAVDLDADELAVWNAALRSGDPAFLYAQPMHVAVGTKPT